MPSLNSKVFLEAQACLKLAIPLAAAQLSESAINFTDTVMMGLLGSQTLAAGALGSTTYIALLWTSSGMVSAVGVLVAIAFGAGKLELLRKIAYQGLWLAVPLSIPMMLLLWNMAPILRQLGQQESTVLLTQSYLRAIVWGFPALIGFSVLKNLVSALNRPQLIMVIMGTGVVVNVVANYILMFGKLGLPALGLAGIGWASTLTLWGQFIAGISLISLDKELRKYQLFGKWYRFDALLFKEIIQIGLPTAILFAIEISLNTFIAYLMGYLGTVPLAAHQIAIQTTQILLMVPLGISYATTMRVGQNLGENDPKGVRRAGFVGMGLGGIFMSFVAVILGVFPDSIAAIYLDPQNPENTEVMQLAITLLYLAVASQLFDGTQVIAGGALRGLKDTRVPLLIGLLAYWPIGLGSGYLMGIYWHWGSVGLWLGLVLGLLSAAVSLIWRFYSQTTALLESKAIAIPENY
ncbi:MULTISPECIES: MATE family efflux transporter [unclassified Nodularia (in: cyanobacteria)]|uniref:MATE family efflux transporter n=1 Tax=unclassified Nodularia (in: cyanobacteria) TaxID=2656917 RepID=UPI00187E6BF6|nr:MULTISPECIES: MATE family efflux transporter [unclassified Nodularia (in: cyanobacteria)]MBE9197863.1 MATE family efflux transporter [Nodularia sp. LEGE 06071]MCC2694611.1 MATE family efflux transporter [Nodularia sp. LEGE 04288]